MTLKRAGLGADVYEPVETASPAKDQLVEYAGSYYSEELDANYSAVVEENDRLVVFGKGAPRRPLMPTYRDGFTTLSGARFDFNRDTQGRMAGFAVQAGVSSQKLGAAEKCRAEK
jgi:hypothetical protein